MTDHKPIGYSVKPPENYKKLRSRKVRLIITYIAIAVIPMLAALFGFGRGDLTVLVTVPVGVITFLAIRMTWPKTKPEYDYTVEGGAFTLAAVYGGRIRRVFLELELADAELIAPLNGVYDGRIKDFAPEKTVNGTFEESQNNYFILYKDEDGTPCIAYIYATEDAIKVMRLLCAKTYLR